MDQSEINGIQKENGLLLTNHFLQTYSVESPFPTPHDILERCPSFSVVNLFSIIALHLQTLKGPVHSKWKLQLLPNSEFPSLCDSHSSTRTAAGSGVWAVFFHSSSIPFSEASLSFRPGQGKWVSEGQEYQY